MLEKSEEAIKIDNLETRATSVCDASSLLHTSLREAKTSSFGVIIICPSGSTLPSLAFRE